MPAFTVTAVLEADAASIEAARQELAGLPGAFNRAVPAAVNKSLDKGYTFVKRRLFETLAVRSQRAITHTPAGKQRIKVLPYGQETAYGGTLRILSREIGLINFKHSVSGGGVKFQIFRDSAGGSDNAKDVRYFIGVGLSGNRHIFYRNLGAPRRKVLDAHYKPNVGKRRQPVHVARGVSLLDVYRRRPALHTETRTLLAKEFPVQMRSQTDRFLERRKKERQAS